MVGGWGPAEEVARRWLTARRGDIDEVGYRYERIPHLIRFHLTDGTAASVLVHEGRVVEERGVDALASYLRAADLLRDGAAGASELTTLLLVFDAHPPVGDHEGYPTAEHYEVGRGRRSPSALAPAVSWDDEGLELTLFYRPLHRDDPGDRLVGGRSGGPREETVWRWTLRVPFEGPARWRDERIPFTPPAGRE